MVKRAKMRSADDACGLRVSTNSPDLASPLGDLLPGRDDFESLRTCMLILLCAKTNDKVGICIWVLLAQNSDADILAAIFLGPGDL